MGDCGYDGCEEPVEKAGLCAGHRKQKQRTGKLTALARRPRDGWARLTDAALAYAHDADEDEDYRKACDNVRKAAISYAEQERIRRAREAVAAKRARGERMGRPPSITVGCPELHRLVSELGIRKAAAHLEAGRMAVWRAVQRCSLPSRNPSIS